MIGRTFIAIGIGLVLAAATVLWIGSGGSGIVDVAPFAPKDAVALARNFTDNLRMQNYDAVSHVMEPQVASSVTPDALKNVARFFPADREQRVVVTNWTETYFHSIAGNSATPTDTLVMGLRYLYSGDRAVQVSFVLHRISGKLFVYSCHVNSLTAQNVHANDFDLARQTPTSDIVIAVAILIDTFAIATFVLCAMGPWPRWRWRWLWMIATLIGSIRINYVFVTGKFYLMPIALLLPPATESRLGLDAPWVLGLTIPIGAIGYWLARSGRQETAVPAVAAQNSGDMRLR